MKKQLFIITFIFYPFFNFAQLADSVRMSEFIGINTTVGSYDNNFIDDLARCAKWIREYHSWGHFEVADNYYKWDNFTTYPQGYSWPDHTKFMQECKRLGINVLIDVLHKPSWAGSNLGAYSTGDGSQASHYLDKLEFIGQLVARYGARTLPDSLLETADKISGLNMIKYYEDDNEPDYWWSNPLWPAQKYAVYCNAVHDGFGVETTSDYPLLGIKSVDSTAQHVLAGLAENSTTYIQQILNESGGRVPFDVINIHTYCKSNVDGYSPENESYGLEKNLGAFMDWRNQNLPHLPVWLTEFGWDTYLLNNSHSYVYAPPPQQANYILRSFFIALKMGFEKAFLFMASDPNSKSIQQFSSSGIITDKSSGLAKKPSYYFLSTLQHVIGNAYFNKTISYKKLMGNNEIYCFEFLNDNEEHIYAIWTRKRLSAADNGTKQNYVLDLGFQAKYAYSVLPKDKKIFGEKVDFEVNGNLLNIELSETPQFVVVKELPTSIQPFLQNSVDFEVFPNPVKNKASLFISNPENMDLKISLYNETGVKMKVLLNGKIESGTHELMLGNDLQAGLYFIMLESGKTRKTKKMVLI